MRGQNRFDSQLYGDIRRSLTFVSDPMSIRPEIDLRPDRLATILEWSANAGLFVCQFVGSEYFTFLGITQSFFMLEPPDFAWKQIYIVPTDDDDENDDNDDDDDYDDENGHNSAHFQARLSRFCMILDLCNTHI